MSLAKPVLAKEETLGSPVMQGVTGDMVRLITSCQSEGLSVFFFGSQTQTIYMLRERVAAGFPRLKIAGICDADFEGCASPAIVDFIAGTKPGLIVLDMAEHEARVFSQANGHRFAGASLVHLEGAFSDYVQPRGERGWLSRAVFRSRGAPLMGRALRQGVFALRFSGVILSQLVQGGRSRLRLARTGAAMRRD